MFISPLVLVVEDDPRIGTGLKAMLIAAGFQVLGPAKTIEQANLLIHQFSPDAAILDREIRDGKIVTVAAVLDAMDIPYLLATAEESATLAMNPVVLETLKFKRLNSGAAVVKNLAELLVKTLPSSRPRLLLASGGH